MDLQINGINYRTGRMSAMVQFHVARRLAPILFSLGQAAAKMGEAGPTEAAMEGALFTGFTAVAEGLSKMSDADSEYVMNACLDITARESGGGWAPLRVRAGLMFQDIDLQAMMKIAMSCIQENLGSFFPGQQPESSGAMALPTSR